MTPEKLAELEALANAATEGPWEHNGEGTLISAQASPHGQLLGETECHHIFSALERGQLDLNDATWIPSPNAAFIATSRAAVPELIAEVRRLAAENRAMREAIDQLHILACSTNGHLVADQRNLVEMRKLADRALSASAPEKP